MRSRLALLLALWLPLQLLLWSIGGHVHLPGVTLADHGCPHAAQATDSHEHPADHLPQPAADSDPSAADLDHRHCHCQLLGITALNLRVAHGVAPMTRPHAAAPPCLEGPPARPERPQWAGLA